MKRKIFGILFAAVVVVSLMMVPAASVGANPGPGLVGLWHFDNDANDSSGNANHGTVYGATYVDGKFGQALNFDGSNDYVDCGNHASLNIAQGTWEAWLNFGAKPSDVGHLMNPLAKQEQYWIHASSDDSIQVKVSVGGTRYIAKTTANFIQTGVWYHVAGTYDGQTLKLYVDGVLKDSNTAPSGNIAGGTAILAIGTWSTLIDYFQGIVDEVRIWDVALTAFPRVLKIDAIAELEAIKDLPCLGKCKGVSLLTLKYTGAAAASIEAISKGKTCFDGDVAAGESFEIDAVDEKLGANTKMYVDGVLATEIHTSCSRPLRVGMRFGDFEVEDVDTLNEADNAIKHIAKSLDGKLWQDARHLDAKHGKKVFDEEKKAVKYLMAICKCKGIRRLTLEYSGGAGADVTVDKGIVTDNGDGTYTITPEEGKSKLAANSKIYIDGVLNTKIHTSCSKPLNEGDEYGDFTVVSVVKVKGKVVFSDDFEDAAFTSTAWTPIAGTWAVEAGQYKQSQDIYIPGGRSVAGQTTWTDYTVLAKVKVVDGSWGRWGGILLRVADPGDSTTEGTYYELYLQARKEWTTGKLQLVKTLAGDRAAIVNPDVGKFWDDGWWYVKGVIRTTTGGAQILGKAWEVGTEEPDWQIQWTDPSPISSGEIGLITFSQLVYFDDVSVLCRCKPEVVAEVHKVIGKLVKADEALARTAIHEAETTTVMDPANQHKVNHEIAKATEEMAKAHEELENKRPDKAIDHKKKAWEHAQHAIKEAMKPPKP